MADEKSRNPIAIRKVSDAKIMVVVAAATTPNLKVAHHAPKMHSGPKRTSEQGNVLGNGPAPLRGGGAGVPPSNEAQRPRAAAGRGAAAWQGGTGGGRQAAPGAAGSRLGAHGSALPPPAPCQAEVHQRRVAP